jgi:hypothetical protein
MATDEPKLKYKWRVTWPGPEDADSHKTDFCGWDGDIRVGRIRLELHSLKKDLWHWAGGGPGHGTPRRLLPHEGFEPTAREAAHKAEDYYERLMAHNGISTKSSIAVTDRRNG